MVKCECPKLAITKFRGVLFFKRRPQYKQITNKNMYFLHEMKDNYLKIYNLMGIILRWKNFNYMLEI